MPLIQSHALELAECATCPECERVLVLSHLPPESKRPFVEGHAQGWVLLCRSCGCEFPVRSAELFQAQISAPVH